MKLQFGFDSVVYSTKSSKTRKILGPGVKLKEKHFQSPARSGERDYDPERASGLATTTEVADLLEEEYGLVSTFVERREEFIAGALEEGFASEFDDALEYLKTVDPSIQIVPSGKGAKKFKGISDEHTDKIEEEFRDTIKGRGFDGIRGVPTLAAQRGVSHLLPHPYSRKNPSRPSFLDTGLYMKSFRVWVEDLDEDEDD